MYHGPLSQQLNVDSCIRNFNVNSVVFHISFLQIVNQNTHRTLRRAALLMVIRCVSFYELAVRCNTSSKHKIRSHFVLCLMWLLCDTVGLRGDNYHIDKYWKELLHVLIQQVASMFPRHQLLFCMCIFCFSALELFNWLLLNCSLDLHWRTLCAGLLQLSPSFELNSTIKYHLNIKELPVPPRPWSQTQHKKVACLNVGDN